MGNRTIGVGFNLERDDADKHLQLIGTSLSEVLSGKPLSNEQITRLLIINLDDTVAEARQLVPNFDELTPVRQRAVIDLVFNMGASTFSKFIVTRTHLKNGNWSGAARSLKRSKWYSQHGVSARPDRIVVAILDGVDKWMK